jgi:hypothetical protein
MIQNRFSNSNLLALMAAFVAAAGLDRNPVIGVGVAAANLVAV